MKKGTENEEKWQSRPQGVKKMGHNRLVFDEVTPLSTISSFQ